MSLKIQKTLNLGLGRIVKARVNSLSSSFILAALEKERPI